MSLEQANATPRAQAAASLLRLGRALRLSPLTALPVSLRHVIQGIAARGRAAAYVGSHDVRELRCPPELIAAQRRALSHLCERIGRDRIGAYLEFGVADGSSLTSMYRVLQEFALSHVRLLGFDPFDADDRQSTGPAFELELTRAILRKRKVDLRHISLTKSPFDRLSWDLRDRHRLSTVSLIAVNCEQAASTSSVLKFCEPLLAGELVLFLHNGRAQGGHAAGERLALDHFLRLHTDLSVRELCSYGHRGTAFVVRRALPV